MPSPDDAPTTDWIGYGVFRVDCYLDTCDCYLVELVEAVSHSQAYRAVQYSLRQEGWMTDPMNIAEDAVEVCPCHLEEGSS